MMQGDSMKQLQVRLPDDLKAWLAMQAQANGSSQNSEVIRAIRERMERTTRTVANLNKEMHQ